MGKRGLCFRAMHSVNGTVEAGGARMCSGTNERVCEARRLWVGGVTEDRLEMQSGARLRGAWNGMHRSVAFPYF